MSARALQLVIDARPRGVRGPLAAEKVLGKSMLDHLLELADELPPGIAPESAAVTQVVVTLGQPLRVVAKLVLAQQAFLQRSALLLG